MLALRVSSRVSDFLGEVESCSGIPQALREEAGQLRQCEELSWDKLKEICAVYSKYNASKAVYLHQLCSQRDIALHAPAPKERNPELVARLAKLQEQLDNKRYSDMVSDITAAERKADEQRGGLLPSTRLQLSFGAHVLVTMFTFWAVAYYGTKMWFKYDELWAGLAGAVGLTLGLLVETGLLIIRSNRPEPLEDRMPHLFDKAQVDEAFAKLRELQAKDRGGKAKSKQQQKQQKQQGGGAVASGDDSKKTR